MCFSCHLPVQQQEVYVFENFNVMMSISVQKLIMVMSFCTEIPIMTQCSISSSWLSYTEVKVCSRRGEVDMVVMGKQDIEGTAEKLLDMVNNERWQIFEKL